MSLTSTTSAQSTYGRLRTKVQGTLTNSYYNVDNPPFYDGSEVNYDGSPDQFVANSFAGFTDNLQFGGALQAGYRARYQFFISGSAAGLALYTGLTVTIAGNPPESFTVNTSDGSVAQYFITQAYPIDGNFQQNAQVVFTSQFDPSTIGHDGATISGLGDFSSTATLTAILLFDANNNLVANYSVSGASGTAYSASGVRLDTIAKSGGGILLKGVGVPNAVHQILATSDLSQPFDSTPIGTPTADANGAIQFTDNTNLARRFYRVVYPGSSSRLVGRLH